MSLLVVGSVAFDGIETPHGKVDRTLGGAASYFALAASHFAPVRLVAVVGEDFTAKDEAVFRGRKIDLAGLEHAKGKSFFWAGRYSQNMNERTTLTTELNVFADFRPTLPASYVDSSFIFLGNIDPKLQRSVLDQIRGKPKVVGLDTMNYWIGDFNAELRETLKYVDILTINDDETRQLTGEHNLFRAAKQIFKMGPTTLIIKRGEHGAIMIHKNFVFSVPDTLWRKCATQPARATHLRAASWAISLAKGASPSRRCVPRWYTAPCWRVSRSNDSEWNGSQRSRGKRSWRARGSSPSLLRLSFRSGSSAAHQ